MKNNDSLSGGIPPHKNRNLRNEYNPNANKGFPDCNKHVVIEEDKNKTKALIIGHMRHGKDTVAEMINRNFGLTFKSSSVAASEIFIYDTLKEKYGYNTPQECFEDRVNHRAEWYDLITEYNKEDKSRLAKGILEKSNIYVGMRDNAEAMKCKEGGLFDFVIGVYDPRKPEEPKDSFNIDIWNMSDFIIPNSEGLKELEKRVIKLFKTIL